MMEEARTVGELAKTGWRPRRTIVYAAWDGEEPGLIGSTEWVETHADLLRKNAAIYINSDTNGRGFLDVGGSHTLEKFINQVASDVVDPEKKISVLERKRASQILGGDKEESREARERSDLRIGALGSGSDFSPFLQHLGIASLNLGYDGENGGGSYHSIYDSFDHYVRFSDPDFSYGIALAQTCGRTVLRFADADILPFEFTGFADSVAKYVKEVTKLADDMREETGERNRRIKDKTYDAVFDPTQPYVVPRAEAAVPEINFAPLQESLTRLEESARGYDAAMKVLAAGGQALPEQSEKTLDEALIATERAMTLDAGLPRRSWYKHQIYAPGLYTGYGVKTLPAVREALEQRNWSEAVEQIKTVAGVLDRASQQIDRATGLLKRNPK
jgi:N-acetylated-alpha-linked acidic dipeptidase